MKKGLLTLIMVCGGLVSKSQIPELGLLTPKDAEINAASGIEKARLYYNAGNLKLAEALLYAELEKGNFSPADFLLFANTLNADNKPSLAQEFYKEYINSARLKNSSASTMLATLKDKPTSDFTKSKVSTSAKLLNPTYYAGKVYSATANGEMMEYIMNCDGDLSPGRQIFSGVTNLKFGKVAFMSGGERAVASLINPTNNTSKLYLITKKKGKWGKPRQLFTEAEGNFAFPSFDEVSQTLYFSSDAVGGLGGYDIYVSVPQGNAFSNMVNLGNSVNTALNEVNPTRTSKWLYFSSNGHISEGGYDIYKFNAIDDFNNVMANAHEFNGKGNDMGLMETGKNAFFKTTVSSEGSYLELYSKPDEDNSLAFSGIVVNESGNPIENAHIFVFTNQGSGQFTTTDKSGKYTIGLKNGIVAKSVSVFAKGYEEKEDNLSNGRTIVLTASKPVVKEVIKEVIKEVEKPVYVNTNTPPTNDNVIVTEQNTIPITFTEREPEVVNTSQEITPQQPDRGLYYIIIGSTNDYADAFSFWQKWTDRFNNLEILEYGNGLYRIGFYAGTNVRDANNEFTQAKRIKQDIWILRPKA